jgi:hypothetical protein
MLNRRILRLRWKKLVLYGAIIVIFSTLYFALYLPFTLRQLPNNLIVYDFPKNRWFDAQEVTISDKAAFFQVPVSNDKLTFAIEYRNKASESLTIQPELEMVYGGKIVQTISTDQITIAPSKSYPQTIIFYSNYTGLNEVILRANIVNMTDGSILESIPGLFYIRIFSQSDAFQSQMNAITNLGIFASVGIAFFTIYISLLRSRLKEKDR